MMPVIFSVLSLCLCIAGFFFFRWYIGRKTAAASLLADYRAEVYRMIAEIDAATDRDSLLVEERIKILRKLLEDTDRRISVYMRELQRSRDGEAMYTSLGRGIRAALDSRPPVAESVNPSEPVSGETAPPAESSSPLESSFPSEMLVQSELFFPAAETAPAPAKGRNAKKRRKQEAKSPASETTAKPKLKVQIAELSAQGLTPPQIASNLGLSLAEVDLALNLLNRQTGN